MVDSFFDFDFIMFIGLPGSGKSTLVREVFTDGDKYRVVSPDDIRRELCGDVSDQGMNSEVWDLALYRVNDYISLGYSVVLDACNVSTDYRNMFMSRLVGDLRTCVILFEFSDIDLLYSRIQFDISQGVDRSNVPSDVLSRMYLDYLDSCSLVLEESWDSIYKYIDGELIKIQ